MHSQALLGTLPASCGQHMKCQQLRYRTPFRAARAAAARRRTICESSVAILTCCIFGWLQLRQLTLTLMCAVAHHAAAVAAPPRVVQKAEDVGLKDAPLRSLYPDEPGKPAPVCASNRHKPFCDSGAAADALSASCELASRTADSTLLKHPDLCKPAAPECSRSWSCKHHILLAASARPP